MGNALSVTRRENFAEWYQVIIKQAELAEVSPVRGCMIIKPWGWGIWERIQQILDRRIKDTGHENCYFPLFIPMSFIAKESEHVEGFAKEMAIVTHHRLKNIDGKLQVDPDAMLEEPLIVRPTSETIIGDAFHRWIRSYRDLPLLLNQWANVVRWEMRTRLFLRTSEFLWQEGHTAHPDQESAVAETLLMLETYREFAEKVLAVPVIAGEKPENERFPGAENTFSIEAMMQDGKALQAGTSHYLGTQFAKAQDIRYQTIEGDFAYCHTTSWGVSTRLIGAIIMTHGDDDGLRLPPAIAPRQIVIVPILRDKPEDKDTVTYADRIADNLKSISALGEPIRAFVDKKPIKSADKRWDWVRRGAPVIIEVGPRDMTDDSVTYMRRDHLRYGNKLKSYSVARSEFITTSGNILEEIQTNLFAEANEMLLSNIRSDIRNYDDLITYFGDTEDESSGPVKGWVRVAWTKPTGSELNEVTERLKALKLTIRNAPMVQAKSLGKCIFTGRQAVEEILIARAY